MCELYLGKADKNIIPCLYLWASCQVIPMTSILSLLLIDHLSSDCSQNSVNLFPLANIKVGGRL